MRGLLFACAALLFGMAGPGAARAQGILVDRAPLLAEQQALLARTTRNPTDHEATYAYVVVSRRLHDDEAAIGALERLLFYNPSLTRAKYELGALYFQMASYEAAARYLRLAMASPDLEEATRVRAEVLLPEADKQRSQSRFSGFFQAGLRYQTNATYIPSGNLVRLSGVDLLINPRDRRRPDGSGFVLAQLSHDYDLENQRGDVLETRFTGFGTKQFRATEYDFGFVEASFGPRFGLPEIMPGASIKPYVAGGAAFVRSEGSPYISSGGGGVSLRLPVMANVHIEPGVEGRGVSVNTSGRFNQVTSTFNTGSSVSFYVASSVKITDDLDVEARGLVLWGDSRFDFQTFTRAGFSGAVNYQFDPPSELIGRKWKLSPYGGIAWVDFEGPNPFVDARIKRHDTEYRVGATLDAPFTETFGLSATVQYDVVDSNLPNYRQRNLTVLGGPTARF